MSTSCAIVLYGQVDSELRQSDARTSALESEAQQLQAELSASNQQALSLQEELTSLQQLVAVLQRQIVNLTSGFPFPAPSGDYANITLSGDNAWMVCAALRLPCPSNPSFQAKAYREGNLTIYVALVSVNNSPYTVEFSDSFYCVSPTVSWAMECP
jgi:hypothetical protein